MSYQYPMERVLYNLHHQVCSFALRRTSSRVRSLAENSLLVLALCGFGALLLAHLSFVYRGNWHLHRLESSMNNGDGRPLRNIPLTCLSSIPGFVKGVDVTHLSLVGGDVSDASDSGGSGMQESRAFHSSWFLDNDADASTSASASPAGTGKQDGLICASSSETSTSDTGSCLAVEGINVLYSYSKVKGYLLLPAEVCAQHNVSVQYVMVSKTDVRCFGEPFLQHLIFRLLAPDSVMLNWLLATYNATGFVYDPRTETMLDLSHSQQHYSQSHSLQNSNFVEQTGDSTHTHSPAEHTHTHTSGITSRYHHFFSSPWYNGYQQLSSKLAVVLKTSFLFFITTTLVSFTLRETQERMLGFTQQLQAHVRSRRPVVNIVTVHIAESLVFVPIMVGMIFFLIEFYRGDKFLAFMVLTIVWLCEVFSVIR
jgi:hypothetical protein